MNWFEFQRVANPVSWNNFWQLTVLIVGTAIVSRYWAKHRPHFCYLLWILVMLKAVQPISIPSLFLPFQQLKNVPAYLSLSDQSSSSVSPITQFDRLEFKTPFAEDPTSSQVVVTEGESTDRAAKETAAQSSFGSRSIQGWSALWLVGVVATFGLSALRIFVANAIRRRGRPASASLQRRLRELMANQGMRPADACVVIVDSPFGPATMGLWKPTILLPANLVDQASDEELVAVLCHELSHILRRDGWAAALQTLAVALWWFHPFVHFASRQASRVRELSCDDMVLLRFGVSPSHYAHALLKVLQLQVSARWQPVLAMASGPTTTMRLNRIARGQARCASTSTWTWLMWFLLLVVFLPGSQPKTSAQSPDADRSSSAGNPLRPPTESVDARQALSRDKSEPARLELRFVNHWLDSPMQNVPVMIEDVADSGEVPFKKSNTLLALGGQLDLSIAPKTVRICVEPDHEYTGYEVINPLPDTITLAAGQTFSHTFRFQPLREFRWPKLIDDTNLCSQRHQQAAAVLRSKGAYLLTNIVQVASGDSLPTTAVVLSETWSGTIEDLNCLLDLDAVMRIEIGRHPVRNQLQRETRLLPTVTDEWMNIFGKMPELEWIWLRNARITSRGIDHLCQSDKLRDVTIESGSFDGEGLAKLSRLPSLSSLVIKAPLRSNAVGSLGRFEHLKTLTLSSSSSVSENLATLEAPELNILVIEPADNASLISLNRFSQLDYVSLSGPGVTDAEVSRLMDVNREIALLGTSVTDEGLAALSNCRVSTITLQGPYTDRALAELRKMPNLLRARFVGAMVSDAAVSDLQQQKPTLTVTRTNPLGDDRLRAF